MVNGSLRKVSYRKPTEVKREAVIEVQSEQASHSYLMRVLNERASYCPAKKCLQTGRFNSTLWRVRVEIRFSFPL